MKYEAALMTETAERILGMTYARTPSEGKNLIAASGATGETFVTQIGSWIHAIMCTFSTCGLEATTIVFEPTPPTRLPANPSPQASTTPIYPPINYTPPAPLLAAPTVINNPVVERVVQETRYVPVSDDAFLSQLADLEKRLLDRIMNTASSQSQHITQVFTTAANLARIGRLADVTFERPTITGGTITDLRQPLLVSDGGTGTSTQPTYGKVLIGNVSGGYDLVATSSLGIVSGSGGSGSSSENVWELINASWIAPTSTVGILVSASSTVGSGTQREGLTISGGATTTGSMYITGNLNIGTTSRRVGLSYQGSSNYGNVDVISASANGESGLNIRSADDLFSEGWLVGKNLGLIDDTFSINRGGNLFNITTAGYIGIGTTSPFRKLSITDAVSTAQQALAYDATRWTDLLTNSVGDFILDPQGNDVFLNDDNLWICAGGSCPSSTPTGTGNLVIESRLGVGTTTPDAKFTIETQDTTTDFFRIASTSQQSAFVVKATGRIGVGTTSPTTQFSISDRLYVGAGGASGLGTATSTFQGDIRITGKLDVGTIDPVYTIGGVKYATYGFSTVGVKEGVALKVTLHEKDDERNVFRYTIDFSTLSRGSDAWLFYNVSDFGTEWEHLTVSLTPQFDGRVFYEVDPVDKTLTIYGTRPGSVSVFMLANRYDSVLWPNLRPDQDTTYPGHIVPEK